MLPMEVSCVTAASPSLKTRGSGTHCICSLSALDRPVVLDSVALLAFCAATGPVIIRLAATSVAESRTIFMDRSLLLLCHFLIHCFPLLPQAARTAGQRFDQPDSKLLADRGNRMRPVPLRPHWQPLAAGSLRVAQVFRSACG